MVVDKDIDVGHYLVEKKFVEKKEKEEGRLRGFFVDFSVLAIGDFIV